MRKKITLKDFKKNPPNYLVDSNIPTEEQEKHRKQKEQNNIIDFEGESENMEIGYNDVYNEIANFTP